MTCICLKSSLTPVQSNFLPTRFLQPKLAFNSFFYDQLTYSDIAMLLIQFIWKCRPFEIQINRWMTKLPNLFNINLTVLNASNYMMHKNTSSCTHGKSKVTSWNSHVCKTLCFCEWLIRSILSCQINATDCGYIIWISKGLLFIHPIMVIWYMHAYILHTYCIHKYIHFHLNTLVAGHSQHSHCKLFTSIVDLQMERVNIWICVYWSTWVTLYAHQEFCAIKHSLAYKV